MLKSLFNKVAGLPRKSAYSVRMQENTDQKKLRIWTPQCDCSPIFPFLYTQKVGFNRWIIFESKKVKLEAQPFTGVLPNSCCKKIFGIRKNHSWWKQFYVKFSVCNVTRKTTPSLLFGWILQYSQEQFLCSTLTGMVVHLLQN